MNFPELSVITPIYNGEKTIRKCLHSIRNQNYPQDKIEIVLVDDDSTDNTLKIAKEFNVRVIRNGHRSFDIGKSLGIQNAKNEFLLFLDGDNILPHKDWIKKSVKCLMENKDAVGAEPIWFSYNKNDPAANRYCSLFGINDPMAFYLKKRDRLMKIEKKWNLIKDANLVEKKDYFIAEFNSKNLPTVGSIGFLTKKSLILKTRYKPYFFHIDSMHDLAEMNINKFILLKQEIVHLHCDSAKSFIKKLKRNMLLFLSHENLRRYKWSITKLKLILTVLIMTTFIIPTYDALRGYVKIRDAAWFLHPLFCFVVPIMYINLFIKARIKHKKQLNNI